MRNLILAIVVLSSLNFGSRLHAQEKVDLAKELREIKSEIKGLKDEVAEVREALNFILQIFERSAADRMPVKDATIENPGAQIDDPSMGKIDAPVTMIEFMDYQCGYCAEFHQKILPEIKKALIDTGKLRYVIMDFPLEMHAAAAPAASLAGCAAKQGKFWEIHDTLFKFPESVADGKFELVTSKVPEIDATKLTTCLQGEEYRTTEKDGQILPGREAAEDLAYGVALGINSTPSFVLYNSKQLGKEVKAKIVSGAQDPKVFSEIVDELSK